VENEWEKQLLDNSLKEKVLKNVLAWNIQQIDTFDIFAK